MSGLQAFDQPQARTDENSLRAHAQLLEKKAKGRIDTYFFGDSITRRWGALDQAALLAHWQKNFFGWNAANFGWGGDTIQNMLWRLQEGELDAVNPKLVVLLAGTNNIGAEPPAEGVERRAQAILQGLSALRREIRARAPKALLLQMGIFPRSDNPAAPGILRQVNEGLAALAVGEGFRYLDISSGLGDGAGGIKKECSIDGLHLTLEGYEVWAQALRPLLSELLGPPAATDQAPPPTGSPA